MTAAYKHQTLQLQMEGLINGGAYIWAREGQGFQEK